MALLGRENEPEDSPARLGAILVADGLHCLRTLRDLANGLTKGGRHG